MIGMFREESGQSVVLIAASLPVVLSLLLLVVDGGRLYVERERIRNAAQLAAEAAVSLAADSTGRSQPSAQSVRDIVREALDRNLPGESFTHSVTAPFRSELSTYNVKVSVTKPFRASIQAVTFTIGADAAAKLGEASTVALSPPPTPPPTSRQSPTPTPTASPTPGPAATPTATPRPAVYVNLCAYAFDGVELDRRWSGVTFVGLNLITQPHYRSTAQHYVSLNGWWAMNGPFTWDGRPLPDLGGWTSYAAVGSSTGGPYGGYGPTRLAQTGTFVPYVYLQGYPVKVLPPLDIVKTSRFDYRCTGGWVE